MGAQLPMGVWMFGRGSQDGLLEQVARLRHRVAELETERARDLRLDT